MLARVFDHCTMKYKKGFRMSTLGWSDGNSFVPINHCLLSAAKDGNPLYEGKSYDGRSLAGRRRSQSREKATDVMSIKDREEFKKFVSSKSKFNPHIMFVSKKNILEKWFHDLFKWLFECEKVFGLNDLKGYDQERLYAYLSERYLSFWFQKYTKTLEWPWMFWETKE